MSTRDSNKSQKVRYSGVYKHIIEQEFYQLHRENKEIIGAVR